MFKVAWFARFREGISKEEGRRYWVEQHAALARATTIERYVQSHVTGPVPALTGVAEEETFFDGYSLGWWSDRGAFEATMASPEWQLVAADGPNVFDVDWLAGILSRNSCRSTPPTSCSFAAVRSRDSRRSS